MERNRLKNFGDFDVLFRRAPTQLPADRVPGQVLGDSRLCHRALCKTHEGPDRVTGHDALDEGPRVTWQPFLFFHGPMGTCHGSTSMCRGSKGCISISFDSF